MKIYKSKIDWWLGIVFVYPLFLGIQSIVEGKWIGFIILFGVVFFIWFISKTTSYIIKEDELQVKSMFIVNQKIAISKIRKIEKSNSILSSPALSLDRIVIRFNKYDDIYISPKQKLEFVECLLSINPSIEVKI
jgi:hypothetical protein